jgi:hypothetical protein
MCACMAVPCQLTRFCSLRAEHGRRRSASPAYLLERASVAMGRRLTGPLLLVACSGDPAP